ncbi:hypothetical protein J7L00_03955 [Candidatus Bathyarchaeota archaeon]|nr:hypothetical protein [Candidatus Bathyarchaeota archaeon]
MPIAIYDLRADGLMAMSGRVIKVEAGEMELPFVGKKRRVVKIILETGYELVIDEDDVKKICGALKEVEEG